MIISNSGEAKYTEDGQLGKERKKNEEENKDDRKRMDGQKR